VKLKPIIDKLKAETTTLNAVSGASEYAAEVEASRLPMPCAFVVRGTVAVDGESRSMGAIAPDRGAIEQILYEEFGIAVAVDNNDKRGQGSEELFEDIRNDLFRALLGWIPAESDGHYNAFEYAGDTTLELNRARVWRLFVFRTSRALSSLDFSL
jgi:hypothetical protein